MRLKTISMAAICAMLFSASLLADQISLAWDPVTGDSRVDGYEVHWGQSPGDYTALQDVPGAQTATADLQIQEPGTYYFAARARNADGSLVSGWSNEVSAVVGEAMPAPGGVHVTVQIAVSTR